MNVTTARFSATLGRALVLAVAIAGLSYGGWVLDLGAAPVIAGGEGTVCCQKSADCSGSDWCTTTSCIANPPPPCFPACNKT
jgi:hypothetical protein